MIKYTNPRIRLIAAIVLLAEIFSPIFASMPAHAAIPPFALAFMRLDRHLAVTPTGGTICATTPATGVGAEATVRVLFPTAPSGTDFVVNSTAANWTVSTTNLPAGASAWPGIGTATSVSGKLVTFPSTALSASTMYCFNFSGTNTLTTSSAGDSFKAWMTTYDSGGIPVAQMETEFGLSIVDGTTKFDQYTITATVPPIFIFYLEETVDSFATDLDPTSVKTSAGVHFDVTTNAKGGWIAWVKDSQQGLYSPTASYKINTSGSIDGAPTTLVTNTEGYVLASTVLTDAAGGCTVSPDPEYDPLSVALVDQPNTGGTLSANFQPVASCTGAPPATSNGDRVGLKERASIAGGTPAGTDYADIITVVSAGNF